MLWGRFATGHEQRPVANRPHKKTGSLQHFDFDHPAMRFLGQADLIALFEHHRLLGRNRIPRGRAEGSQVLVDEDPLPLMKGEVTLRSSVGVGVGELVVEDVPAEEMGKRAEEAFKQMAAAGV